MSKEYHDWQWHCDHERNGAEKLRIAEQDAFLDEELEDLGMEPKTRPKATNNQGSRSKSKKSDNSIEGCTYGCFTVFAIIFLFMVMCSRK